MSEDEPLGLAPIPKGSESTSTDPTNKRDYDVVLLITFTYLLVGGFLAYKLLNRPGGIQVFAMIGYTFLIPYIASNRFLNFVPWDRLISGRVVLGHCFALMIVYGITTEALTLKTRLPAWFLAEGRKGSVFDLSLLVIVVALAFCEHSWAMRPSRSDQSSSVS